MSMNEHSTNKRKSKKSVASNMQAQEGIFDQENLFKSALISIPYPIYIIDTDSYKVLTINSAASQHNILPKNTTCYALMHKSDKPCSDAEHPCPIEEIKKTKKPVVLEHIHHDKDGNARCVEVHAYPIFDSEGNITQMVECCVDVTEQRQAAEALQKSNKKFKDLVEITTDWVWEVDAEGNYTYASPKVRDLLGYQPDEIIGRTPFDLMPAEEAKRIGRIFNAIVAEKDAFCGLENTNRHKDGHLVVLETSGIPILDEKGKLQGYRGIDRDITERMKTEHALRDSEHKYRVLAESSPDAVFVNTPEGKCLYVNGSAAAFLGKKPAEIIGKNITDLFPNEVSQTILVKMKEVIEQDNAVSYEIAIPSGLELRYFSTIASPIYDNDGTLASILGVAHDITKRKNAEDALNNALVESQQRSSETSALLRGARAVLEHREFEHAARSIFDSCKDLIGATAGYVALLSANEEQNDVIFLDAGDRRCTVDPNLPMPIRGLREQAYCTGKTVYHNDFSNSQWTKYMPAGHVTLNNVLFAPLIIEKKVVGLLGLGNKPGGFCENDAKMAAAFGELAAIALHNSRTLESLEQSEEELKHHQLHLEDQVKTRTEEVTRTNEQLLQKIEDRKRLEKEILDISEREKRLIGRTLHDSIGQQLAGIAFMTEVLEQKLTDKSPDEASYAAKITSLTHQSMNQARGLAKGLHPVDLQKTSLTTILQELATTMKHLFGISCTFEFDEPVEVDNVEAAIHLYRIAQEAVTNAAKHAKSKNIQIRLSNGKDRITLTVENDGLDFPKKRSEGEGMGLKIMEYRAEMINGSLDIRKRKKGGTVLACVFPNNKH